VSFTQHWSAKAEWLYLDLADRRFPVTAANNGLAANLVRFIFSDADRRAAASNK
jgi:hypothetical protein